MAVLRGLDRIVEKYLNLADYIFLRRVNLAWTTCTSEQTLSVFKASCAMRICAPGRTIDYSESKVLLNIIYFMKTGWLPMSTTHTTFQVKEFIQIAHIYYYFNSFDMPFLDNVISKADILRVIDEQSLPTSLSPMFL